MKLKTIRERAAARIAERTDFPVLSTASVLWQRLARDRLPLTASSLTYTTVLALVPLFTVVLSVFTVFPIFAEMQEALQEWLAASLIPERISDNVMQYLTVFASKASQLGLIGVAGLAVTALSLMLTIERTLNQIWQARSTRPISQRILVYWGALTLGPLILAASLAISSFLLARPSGWLPRIPIGADFALSVFQFLLMTAGVTLLYRLVPAVPVRWQHALAGALFVTVAMSLAKWGMGEYLGRSEKWVSIYGAFAVLPILLLWIYLSWLIVLIGAVIAAYLPTILRGAVRQTGPGWEFELALRALQLLSGARRLTPPGLTEGQLATALHADPMRLRPLLSELRAMDWVGQLATQRENEAPRYVLLCDPAKQALEPLVQRLLLPGGGRFARLWRGQPLAQLRLVDTWVN